MKTKEKQERAISSAKLWAEHCNFTPADASIAINNRHIKIADMFYRFMDTVTILSGSNDIRSVVYKEKLKELCDSIEEEMDYGTERMNLLMLITNNDLNKPEKVHYLYDFYIKTTDV